MEIKADVLLRGPVWARVLEQLKNNIFKTYWDTYALCISIGMMYDEQVESKDMSIDNNEDQLTVPRNILLQEKNKSLLEFMFQTALVTTKHLDLSEEERLELAFGEEKKAEFNELAFLTKFANYGVLVLDNIIAETDDVELMEKLMTFLNSTYESGANLIEDTDSLLE